MAHLLTREEVTFAILGDLPGVYMTDAHDIAKGQPFAVAAIMATDPDEALEYAVELKGDIAKRFPAWRGWGIQYAPADTPAPAAAALCECGHKEGHHAPDGSECGVDLDIQGTPCPCKRFRPSADAGAA